MARPLEPVEAAAVGLVDDQRGGCRLRRAASMFFGQSSRVVQGERTRPMNTMRPSPSSPAGSKPSSCSPSRFSNTLPLRHACAIFFSVRDIAVASSSKLT